MNQSNSQIQFLQLVCVVLVMATLIGLVAAYVLYSDVRNLERELAEVKGQVELCKGDRVEVAKDLQTLKDLTGYGLPKVGEEDSLETDTIVGKARSDIRQFAGSQTKLNLRDALMELHGRLVEVTNERNTLQEELKELASRGRIGN